MAFDLPRGIVVPVDAVDVTLDDAVHPFEAANREAIAANWLAEHEANPALFNGTMVLLSELALLQRRLTGRCHPVQYATMLYWRRHNGAPDVEHSFAFPALVARDNALVAIRMGRHTANPGRVYFAAGSFEPHDFVGGKVDMTGNMVREVREETGLDISDLRTDRQDHLFSINHSSVIFRRYWLDEDADTIARRIEAFVAAEPEPEIEEPVIIRGIDDAPDGMVAHMAEIVRWHFEGGETE